ncbi:MAG TPA: M3 family oligoendopeptidase, partial [Firmicutes bacterium]|nr:M3 family oligoendopeptidase [Bacillota bacterium]
MPTFKDYYYERPTLESLETEFKKLLHQFDQAPSFALQNEIMTKINELRTEFESMQTLVYIRHSINTTDEFYEKENDYFDEISPLYEGLVHQYYQSLINSENHAALEKRWGKQLFRIVKL